MASGFGTRSKRIQEMNGKKAKAIRRAIGKEKATPLDGGGLVKKDGKFVEKDGKLLYRLASNPQANSYRMFKKLSRLF